MEYQLRREPGKTPGKDSGIADPPGLPSHAHANRLVAIRSGFTTENEARESGLRAKRMIDCTCYPNPERLTLVVKIAGKGVPDRLAASGELLDPEQLASHPSEVNLKYFWKRLSWTRFLSRMPKTCPAESTLQNTALRPGSWIPLLLTWTSALRSARPSWRYADCSAN
jgi:hypothetical protein